MKEIELKFRLDKFPGGLTLIDKSVIFQSYATVTPPAEVRLRKEVSLVTGLTMCTIATKYPTTEKNVREESELPLPVHAYAALAGNISGHPMTKVRHYLYDVVHDLSFTADVFMDSRIDLNLMIAEVEFPTVEAMESFEPPAYLNNPYSVSNALLWEQFCKSKRNELVYTFTKICDMNGRGSSK